MNETAKKSNSLLHVSVTITIVVVAVFLLISAFLTIYIVRFLFGAKSNDMNIYINIAENNDFLPGLDELGEYDDIFFQYMHRSMLIFESDAYVLKISYDDDDYEEQKAALNNIYSYQSTPLGSDFESPKEPEFTVDTFSFRVLSMEEYDFSYPHQLVFVGISDENKQIAYVYYYDTDLDFIETSFETFLRHECGW